MKKSSKTMLVTVLLVSLLSLPSFNTSILAASNTYDIQDTKEYQDKLKSEALNKESFKDERTIQSIGDQIDTAYQNMLLKENYIVDLINKIDSNKTTFSNWQYNLQYLTNNYDIIKSIPDVNMDYVDGYIEEYTYTLKSLQLPEEKNSNDCSVFASYSRTAAVNYALTYLGDYNTNYPDWGADCANFISQCLYEGGKPMEGTPGTQSAAENWKNWFSKGNTTTTKNVSSTWRGAAAFRDYWQTHASGYKKFTSMDSDAFDYGYTGDAISLLNSNGAAYHTLMIVGYGSTDFEVAAHSDSLVVDGEPYFLSERSDSFIIYDMD